MNIKMFNKTNLPHLPHELLWARRQKIKLINALVNDMSTDIKLPNTQTAKIIQSGEFLGSLLSKIAVSLIKIAVLLAKNI